MKSLVATIALVLSFGSVAGANICSEGLSNEIQKLKMDIRNEIVSQVPSFVISTGTGGLTTAGIVFGTSSTAGTAIAGAAVMVGGGIYLSINSTTAEDRKVKRALEELITIYEEAYMGKGLWLQKVSEKFAQEGIVASEEKLADLIIEADESQLLCEYTHTGRLIHDWPTTVISYLRDRLTVQ